MRYMTKRERIIDEEADRERRQPRTIEVQREQLKLLGGPLTGPAANGSPRELLREMKSRLMTRIRSVPVDIVTPADIALLDLLELDPDLAKELEAQGHLPKDAGGES